MATDRPHVLGIDDGPFLKGQDGEVPLVAVMMEGAHLVESVATTSFPVDGDDVNGFLVRWVREMRVFPALQAIALGGITIAGLAVVDVPALARELELPVLVVNRRDPSESRLASALEAAGFGDRVAVVERTPPAVRLHNGVYVAWSGTTEQEALELARATLRKAYLPEPLRVAHLIARAMVDGESRGRV